MKIVNAIIPGTRICDWGSGNKVGCLCRLLILHIFVNVNGKNNVDYKPVDFKSQYDKIKGDLHGYF